MTMRQSSPDKPSPTKEELHHSVWQKLRQQDFKSAVELCHYLNSTFPHYPDGWHVASHVALKLGNAKKARDYIEKAVVIDPSNAAWKIQMAQCLQSLGEYSKSIALAKELNTKILSSAIQFSALGRLLTQQTEYSSALDAYKAAINLEPKVGVHHYNKAAVERFMGDLEAAEKSSDEAIKLNPADYEAYLLRSELKKQTLDNNHALELENLLEKGIDSWRGKVQICHALAKEFEDLNEYQQSFRWLKEGADCRRSNMQYEVENDEETITKIIETYDHKTFNGSIKRHESSEAIFIVGLPRTGTTLVERILGSHFDVHSAGELNNFSQQLMILANQKKQPDKLSRNDLVSLTAQLDFAKLGEDYIKSTRPFTGHTKYFVDKLPLNFLYAGLIHLALPNAKIIHLTRHPIDTCYAIYKRLFKDAYPFSYSLEDLGRYYVAYAKLMTHWHNILPGKIYSLAYEDLVENTESETRSLLSFCGLPWSDACLNFHENTQASTTASASQIRMPIYGSSVEKWRHYEEQLSPLIKILKDADIDC